MIGRIKGYEVIIVMPDTMSVERRNLIKAYGAQLVLTDGTKGMKGAINKAKEIAEGKPDFFIPQQFNNLANPEKHYATTAEEIIGRCRRHRCFCSRSRNWRNNYWSRKKIKRN